MNVVLLSVIRVKDLRKSSIDKAIQFNRSSMFWLKSKNYFPSKTFVDKALANFTSSS